jgi:hypothetical protein
VKRLLSAAWGLGLVLVAASAAWAQTTPVPAPGGFRPDTLLGQVISTLVFSLLGIILAIVGFKAFDAVIPFSLEREICEKNNLSVSILASAMVLGVCIIIAFVVGSS